MLSSNDRERFSLRSSAFKSILTTERSSRPLKGSVICNKLSYWIHILDVNINGQSYHNTASSQVTISLCTIVDLNVTVSNKSGKRTSFLSRCLHTNSVVWPGDYQAAWVGRSCGGLWTVRIFTGVLLRKQGARSIEVPVLCQIPAPHHSNGMSLCNAQKFYN